MTALDGRNNGKTTVAITPYMLVTAIQSVRRVVTLPKMTNPLPKATITSEENVNTSLVGIWIYSQALVFVVVIQRSEKLAATKMARVLDAQLRDVLLQSGAFT